MIDTIWVRDFKSLVDVRVELGTVNVFIGANGSGKSNLLEAIGILGAAASGRVNDESLKYRGVRPGLPVLYKSSFKHKTGAMHIFFEAHSANASYSVTLWNPIDKPNDDWQYKHEGLWSGGHQIVGRSPRTAGRLSTSAGYAALKAVDLSEDDPAGELLDLLSNYAIYAPDTPTLRGLEPDSQSREPVGLAGGRLPEGLSGLRGRLVDLKADLLPLVDWLHNFASTFTNRIPISGSVPQPTRGLRFVDEYMKTGRNLLSGHDASEGVLYLLFGAVLALHSKSPKLFAIDNFDQALNPRTARDFACMFCQWLLDSADRQVLLTTHNPLVLDGLPLGDERVRLFAVDRSKRGYTVVSRVEIDKKLLAAAKRGVPLSQLWVNGSFGGVPPSV